MYGYYTTKPSKFTQSSYLAHHGIKGQKWGIRRYENYDGTLTEAGKKRYGYSFRESDKVTDKNKWQSSTAMMYQRRQYDDTKRAIKKENPMLSKSEIEKKVKEEYDRKFDYTTGEDNLFYNIDKTASDLYKSINGPMSTFGFVGMALSSIRKKKLGQKTASDLEKDWRKYTDQAIENLKKSKESQGNDLQSNKNFSIKKMLM